MKRLAVILALVGISNAASAAKVGDVLFLSKGAGETVLTVTPSGDTIQITMRALAVNAAEYCERYENIRPNDLQWRKCLSENTAPSSTTMTVNCRAATIILAGGNDSGSYRRAPGGGPWTSVTNPDWIIQADDTFENVCGRR